MMAVYSRRVFYRLTTEGVIAEAEYATVKRRTAETYRRALWDDAAAAVASSISCECGS